MTLHGLQNLSKVTSGTPVGDKGYPLGLQRHPPAPKSLNKYLEYHKIEASRHQNMHNLTLSFAKLNRTLKLTQKFTQKSYDNVATRLVPDAPRLEQRLLW